MTDTPRHGEWSPFGSRSSATTSLLEMRAHALHHALNISMPAAIAATEAVDLTVTYPRLRFDGIQLERRGPTWFGRYEIAPRHGRDTAHLPERRYTDVGLALVELPEATAFLRQLHAEQEIDDGDIADLQDAVEGWNIASDDVRAGADEAEASVPDEIKALWVTEGRCEKVIEGNRCVKTAGHTGICLIVNAQLAEPGRPRLLTPQMASGAKRLPDLPEDAYPVDARPLELRHEYPPSLTRFTIAIAILAVTAALLVIGRTWWGL